MKNSESVDIKDTTIPRYPLMSAADEIARRAVHHEIVDEIIFKSNVEKYNGAYIHYPTETVYVGIRDCDTAAPFALAHEVGHAIDHSTDFALSESVDVEVIDEPEELVAETFEKACLHPDWVEDNKRDVALMCHDMSSEDVPSSLVPSWHL